jgi:CxxC motif-containing protein (DUF1111 family)/WD40 repeat protein
MKVLKLFAIAFFASVLVASLALAPAVSGRQGATEAPAAFDNQTNGFEPQGDPNTPNTFLGDKAAFETRDTNETGLGPVYNAQACVECHQNRVTGGVSQILEIRAGHNAPDGTFVPAAGGSVIQTRAINTTIQERVPIWSRLAFTNNSGQISVVGFDLDAGAVGNPPVAGTFPTWSPDGTKIAFTSNLGGIWVMNNDGTNLQQLTRADGDTQPAWSPDGTKIAFSSQRTGVAKIFTMNPDGSGQTQITTILTFNDRQPAWSPDGTKIAFQRTPNAVGAIGKIWTMSSTGAGQTQISLGPGNDERPSYSPDGASIAFSTNRDGNYEIYKLPSAGGVATRLTINPASDRNPTWATDNTCIAFGSDRNAGLKLWAIAPDGSNPTQISGNNEGGGDLPAFSRDAVGENIRTFRASLNVLGDGFVECIADSTLLAIRDAQPSSMRGTAISVDVLEAPNQTRIGRFGWKNSIASLLHFSADAYLNEVGITSPLRPKENTSLGRTVTPFDLVADPEDDGGDMGFGEDVEAFTRFMRSTKAPPRSVSMAINDATDPGSALFDSLSCNVCHVRSITTAPVGSVINGGTFVVPDALGNKVIHPFSDFLLHDIGTGDGIVETNGELTRNKMRTAPLWGLRTHDKLMHDGGSSSAPSNSGAQSFAVYEAILRHAGQANSSRVAFQALSSIQKAQLITFLKSL